MKCLDSLKNFCRFKEDLIENQMKLFMTEALEDQTAESEQEEVKFQEEVVEVFENIEDYEKTLKVENLDNQEDIEEIKFELFEQDANLVQDSNDTEEQEEMLEVEYMEEEPSEMVIDFQMLGDQFQQDILETDEIQSEYKCFVRGEGTKRSRSEKMTPEQRKERRKVLRKAT